MYDSMERQREQDPRLDREEVKKVMSQDEQECQREGKQRQRMMRGVYDSRATPSSPSSTTEGEHLSARG